MASSIEEVLKTLSTAVISIHAKDNAGDENGISILVPYSADGTASVWHAQHVAGIKKIVVGNNRVDEVEDVRSLVAIQGVENVVTAVCATPTYGAVAPTLECAAEVALRVVLKCIESHANRHGRYIQPMVCVSLGDGGVKVCVKVFTSPVVVKQTLSKLSMIYQCTGCQTFTLQPLGLAEPHPDQKNRFKFSLPRGQPVGLCCEHCQAAHKMAGPVWRAPLHCSAFLAQLSEFCTTATSERFKQLVAAVAAELDDVCFHYSLESLRSTLPSEPAITLDDLRSALHEYRVAAFHGSEHSVQTDAPACVVWAAVTRWQQQQHVTLLPAQQAGGNIRATLA